MEHVIATLTLGFLAALIAAAAVVAWRHFHPVEAEDEEGGGEVAEYMSMMIALLYALLLGLALVSVWELRGDAEGHTSTEAGALHQMTVLAEGLPPDQKKRVESVAERYAVHVVRDEWPRMRQGAPPTGTGWDMVRQLRAVSAAPPHATSSQEVTALELLGQLSALDDARRGREAVSQDSLSPVLWAGLFVGAILSIGMLFFFGIGRSPGQLMMAMGMVVLTVFLGLLIHYLSTPFGDVMGVSPDPFTRYFPMAA
ncbi:bestrophin-like domain [Streptomyces lavendofoliae]|uniref:DUF4239 domain-containing protein n=1 Tax=Streptomyces lavendofoliae TaxID=67314 RepID=A0A918M3M9_9ACTN|nr:DUF4239 domain-containing protein [Streptomyces lavendofoliae]GGU27814.1 hypothetical protein GCM10010274_13130 [Streptomyces lavendofoliae]